MLVTRVARTRFATLPISDSRVMGRISVTSKAPSTGPLGIMTMRPSVTWSVMRPRLKARPVSSERITAIGIELEKGSVSFAGGFGFTGRRALRRSMETPS